MRLAFTGSGIHVMELCGHIAKYVVSLRDRVIGASVWPLALSFIITSVVALSETRELGTTTMEIGYRNYVLKFLLTLIIPCYKGRDSTDVCVLSSSNIVTLFT
jgi:hypothetical protein